MFLEKKLSVRKHLEQNSHVFVARAARVLGSLIVKAIHYIIRHVQVRCLNFNAEPVRLAACGR